MHHLSMELNQKRSEIDIVTYLNEVTYHTFHMESARGKSQFPRLEETSASGYATGTGKEGPYFSNRLKYSKAQKIPIDEGNLYPTN